MVDTCIVTPAPSNSISGVINVSGLTIAGRITEVTINDATWTALPATPLTNRNAMSIQNRSGVEIKLNYDNTVATYFGVVITNNGERMYDITDDIIIYAKSSSGTVNIVVEEIS